MCSAHVRTEIGIGPASVETRCVVPPRSRAQVERTRVSCTHVFAPFAYAARRPRFARVGFALFTMRLKASLTDFESGNASTRSASRSRRRSGSPIRSLPTQ